MMKRQIFSILFFACINLLIVSCQNKTLPTSPPPPTPAVRIGFDQLNYYAAENSEKEVCLLITIYKVLWFQVVVNTHPGVADESDFTPLRNHHLTIYPGKRFALRPPGSRIKSCFTVNIINDLMVEENETFTLSLAAPLYDNPSGVEIDERNNGTVITIVDNDRQPSCLSFLRFTRPDLFLHCNAPSTCTYSTSKWKTAPGTEVAVPLGICKSGEAETQSRYQTAPENGCVVKTERRQRCILMAEERLISTFNLGIRPESGDRVRPTSIPSNSSRVRRHMQCSSNEVCRDHNQGRNCMENSTCEPTHGTQCILRTIVFVLDTSGSIGPDNFKSITQALSRLVPLFCDNMQVAMVSYSDDIHIEFCFDCHDLSNFFDRARLASSIQGIRYRDGLTHTGRATRCVADYILNPSSGCGIDTSTDCVDIIYVTDGNSNGPLKYPQSCIEATCLKNHPDWCGRVNTYAIAIGGYVNIDEIQCLTKNSEDSVFNVTDVSALQHLITKAEILLQDDNNYNCVKQNDTNFILGS